MNKRPGETTKEYQSRWHKERRAAQKAAGKCGYTGCNRPPEPGITMCQYHQSQHNERSNRYYERKRRDAEDAATPDLDDFDSIL